MTDSTRTGGSSPVVADSVALPSASFTLAEEIGRGGMGVVYRAHDHGLNREVAVKILQERYAPDSGTAIRFVEEARITGQLQHPGIPAVYQVGTWADGRPFLAMKLIKGRTLDHLLKVDGPHPTRWLGSFEGICHAVGYAHARGVIHRDLKPSNVMVGAFGEVQVMDWGLAKVLTPGGRSQAPAAAKEETLAVSAIRSLRDSDGSFTQAGSVLGTPAYMPPEQAVGETAKIDQRADVFGLGAILCFMLTGRPPYEGESAESIRIAAMRGKTEEAFARLDGCGAEPEVVALCKKCLAFEPADRPANADAVAREVARIRTAADDRARQAELDRARATVQAAEQQKRRRTLLLAGGGLVAVLTLGVIGTAIGLVEARKQRDAADHQRKQAEEGFRQARRAVDEYFTAISESKLLDTPGLQPLRQELLDAARRYYEDFLREHGTDPAVRSEAAAAFFRVAVVSVLSPKREEAIPIFRRAIALYDELVMADPDNAVLRSELAQCHGSLGLLLDGLERDDEAMAEYREAIRLRSELAAQYPETRRYRVDLARSYRLTGGLYHKTFEFGQAVEYWKKARAIQEAVLRDPPTQQEVVNRLDSHVSTAVLAREDLADTLTDLSSTYRETGRWNEALETGRRCHDLVAELLHDRPRSPNLLSIQGWADAAMSMTVLNLGQFEKAVELGDRAVGILEKLVADNPTVGQYRNRLAEAHLYAGFAKERLGRLEDAAAHFRRTAELGEVLVATEPTSASARGMLAQGLLYQARLLVRAGKLNEAVPLLRRSQATLESVIRDKPRIAFYRMALAFVSRALGRAEEKASRPAEALAAFDRARQLDAGEAEKAHIVRYNEACDLALMARASSAGRRVELADRAVEALRRAIAQGYRSYAELSTDEDVSVLRGRPDFEALQASIRPPEVAPPPRLKSEK